MDEEITQLLQEARAGKRDSMDRLMEVVYEDLRGVARRHMSAERESHTLQPTALVHEVYLRVFGGAPVDWQNRNHFYAVMARQMRQVLIDQGREFRAAKRGGGVRISLDEARVPGAALDYDIEAVDELLRRLQKTDPTSAKVVELKFFAGLTDREVADAVGVSHSTVRRHWEFARAWFSSKLSKPAPPG